MLIQSFLSFLCDHYPSIQLAKLYAYASTDEGFDLMQQLLFSPRYDLGENVFELDPMRRNRSRLVRMFQECIQQKREMSEYGTEKTVVFAIQLVRCVAQVLCIS